MTTTAQQHAGLELLTIKEVSKLLKVCERSVFNLVDRGEFLSPQKLGGSSRWRAVDVREWLDQKFGRTEIPPAEVP